MFTEIKAIEKIDKNLRSKKFLDSVLYYMRSTSPGQETPQNADGRLQAILGRFRTPQPQVTGESIKSLKSDQLQSTATMMLYQIHQPRCKN